jgi:hypothetical protein
VNLRGHNIDTMSGVLYVVHTLSERDNGRLDDGNTTTSPAGVRSVAMPALVLPELTAHLAEFTNPAPGAFVFLGELGGRLRRSNFHRAARWQETLRRVGYLRTSTSTTCGTRETSSRQRPARLGRS